MKLSSLNFNRVHWISTTLINLLPAYLLTEIGTNQLPLVLNILKELRLVLVPINASLCQWEKSWQDGKSWSLQKFRTVYSFNHLYFRNHYGLQNKCMMTYLEVIASLEVTSSLTQSFTHSNFKSWYQLPWVHTISSRVEIDSGAS